jgi:hypothetical protein
LIHDGDFKLLYNRGNSWNNSKFPLNYKAPNDVEEFYDAGRKIIFQVLKQTKYDSYGQFKMEGGNLKRS